MNNIFVWVTQLVLPQSATKYCWYCNTNLTFAPRPKFFHSSNDVIPHQV